MTNDHEKDLEAVKTLPPMTVNVENGCEVVVHSGYFVVWVFS